MTEPVQLRLLDAAARAPVILDAAMGTRLIARGLDLERDDPCFWNLSRPDAVAEIHARDVAAGAVAVLTNTFGANRVWLARSGRAAEAVAINRRGVEIGRAAVGADGFVVGSIGPTSARDPASCREQAEALAEAGVDALVFETHRHDDAVPALAAVRSLADLPLLVSLVAWPEPAIDAVRRLEDLGAAALGGNCQRGIEPALAMARRIGPLTRLPILVKPGGGCPGDPPEPPETFASAVPALVAAGVRFLGGCCGTTEAHVAALRAGCYARRRG